MLCRQCRFREREKECQEASLKKCLYRQKQCENSKILAQNYSSSCHVKMSQFEEDTDYVTPDKYKKQIRQRTFDVAQKLPNSPGLKTAVISRCVKKLIRSPSTHLEMTRVINRYSSQTVVARFKDNQVLQQIVLRIRKYKVNRNVSRLTKCINELKQMRSIRQEAKRLNIHYSSLHRMMTLRDQSMRRVRDEHRVKVHEFYSSMSVSLQLPYKKYAKFYYL